MSICSWQVSPLIADNKLASTIDNPQYPLLAAIKEKS